MDSRHTYTTPEEGQRIIFLDFLRVIACFMVILVHACEFYYLNAEGVFFNSDSDRAWIAIIDGAGRCSVPLFVMASSYLLLPLRYSAGTFARKRFVRIIVPFAVWSLFYAIVPGLAAGSSASDILIRTCRLITNFNDEGGHLWFIYMLVGIYMIMPVISPWIQTASRRAELTFLGIWFVSCTLCYLRPLFGEMWGQCAWNEFHALYYYSGFIGYVVLAHCIRKYTAGWSTGKNIAVGVPLFAIGYAITATVFYNHGAVSTDYAYVEQSWNFCSFNVALMTAGAFLIIKCITRAPKRLYAVVRRLSNVSFAIYLMHIFVLGFVFPHLSAYMGADPAAGLTDGPMTGACIFASALLTFVICSLVSLAIKPIPGSKYILG